MEKMESIVNGNWFGPCSSVLSLIPKKMLKGISVIGHMMPWVVEYNATESKDGRLLNILGWTLFNVCCLHRDSRVSYV